MLCEPLAYLVDDSDVGEEMVVLGGGHGFPQSIIIFEVAHQYAQAVQVRMLRCDDLKNGLADSTRVSQQASIRICHRCFVILFTNIKICSKFCKSWWEECDAVINSVLLN